MDKERKLLIISDEEGMAYWNTLSGTAKKKVGFVHIQLDKDIATQMIHEQYGAILIDISDISDLYRMIPVVHLEQPASRIIVVTSAPVWKFTREVLRLGAADLIRRRYTSDQVINELYS